MTNEIDGQRTVRRAELVTWESAAWGLTGTVWIVSAWPGLIVDWDGAVFVPAIASVVFALFAACTIARGAPSARPASSIASRTWRSNRRSPKSRQALKRAVIVDAVLWAGSGLAWCLSARKFGWSETVTGAMFQVGIGVALTAWAALGAVAAKEIGNSTDNTVVVRRRTLGAGPMTVRRQQLPAWENPGNAYSSVIRSQGQS